MSLLSSPARLWDPTRFISVMTVIRRDAICLTETAAFLDSWVTKQLLSECCVHKKLFALFWYRQSVVFVNQYLCLLSVRTQFENSVHSDAVDYMFREGQQITSSCLSVIQSVYLSVRMEQLDHD
jgi:hypothetical protein